MDNSPQIGLDDLDTFLRECVAVDESALQEEYIRLASDFAVWNERYALTYRRHARTKAAGERLRARLYAEKAATLEASTAAAGKSKAPTKDAISAAVDVDPEWIAIHNTLIDAEVDMIRHKGILEALRAKRDMVVNLGATIRAEKSHAAQF